MEQDYYSKYLKYKNKYIYLKKQIGGLPCISNECILKKAGVRRNIREYIYKENINISKFLKLMKDPRLQIIEIFKDQLIYNIINFDDKIINNLIDYIFSKNKYLKKKYIDIVKDFEISQLQILEKLFDEFENIRYIDVLIDTIKNNKDKTKEDILIIANKAVANAEEIAIPKRALADKEIEQVKTELSEAQKEEKIAEAVLREANKKVKDYEKKFEDLRINRIKLDKFN